MRRIRNKDLTVCAWEEGYVLWFPALKNIYEIWMKADGSFACIYYRLPMTEEEQDSLFLAIRPVFLFLAQKKGMFVLHSASLLYLEKAWLFSGTIMENIRYGRLDATDEEVIAAAKAAHVHNFIMQQPGGYQMVLDEETSNVSQGQKQLLTIARAILADNKILILDEATSSVDTRTEMQIQKAMDNLMKGRTSFIIAHRLSTIRDADLILVMKDGDIIEQGNHEELLQKNGFYAQLYNSQFEEAS